MRAPLLLSLLIDLAVVAPALAEAPEASRSAAEGMGETTAARAETDAPRGFYDLSMVMRLLPEGEATTFGLSLGAMYRPILRSCMHLTAEVGFDRGQAQRLDADDVSVFRAALGASWGRATRDGLWLGGGPMVDLGHARVDSDTRQSDGFSSSVALRATARLRLKGAAFTYVDLRIGYAVPKRLVTLSDGTRYGIGGPLLAVAIGASLGP